MELTWSYSLMILDDSFKALLQRLVSVDFVVSHLRPNFFFDVGFSWW